MKKESRELTREIALCAGPAMAGWSVLVMQEIYKKTNLVGHISELLGNSSNAHNIANGIVIAALIAPLPLSFGLFLTKAKATEDFRKAGRALMQDGTLVMSARAVAGACLSLGAAVEMHMHNIPHRIAENLGNGPLGKATGNIAYELVTLTPLTVSLYPEIKWGISTGSKAIRNLLQKFHTPTRSPS